MTEDNDEQYEVRLKPIYSCKECDYLGKEIIAADERTWDPGRYTTFCTHLAGQTRTIKHGTEQTPEHYKFPKWCLLQKRND